MGDKFFTAGIEQVENFAKQIIKEDFSKLANIKIGFQFRDKARISKGQIVYASPKKIPAKEENFIDVDLIITVAEDKWSAADNVMKKAILDDVFRTIELEDKEEAAGFPRRIADNRYMLSDGRKIKGQREAEKEQAKICDYDINIVAHSIQANGKNFEKYGPWRKGLEEMQHSVQQTKIEFPEAK